LKKLIIFIFILIIPRISFALSPADALAACTAWAANDWAGTVCVNQPSSSRYIAENNGSQRFIFGYFECAEGTVLNPLTGFCEIEQFQCPDGSLVADSIMCPDDEPPAGNTPNLPCEDSPGFCTDSGMCSGPFGDEPTQLCLSFECPDGSMAEDALSCSVRSEEPFQCPDGSSAVDEAGCPDDSSGPGEENQLIDCPDGSQAVDEASCPDDSGEGENPGENPGETPTTVDCPDGSTASDLASCPQDTETVTCEDGSTAVNLASCPPGQVMCADGSIADDYASCPLIDLGTTHSIYTQSGKTIAGATQVFITEFTQTTLYTSLSEAFTIEVNGSCPTWQIPSVMGMPPIDVDYICRPFMTDVFNVIAGVLLLVATLIAIRIMLAG
jgi:hypothetical protein